MPQDAHVLSLSFSIAQAEVELRNVKGEPWKVCTSSTSRGGVRETARGESTTSALFFLGA